MLKIHFIRSNISTKQSGSFINSLACMAILFALQFGFSGLETETRFGFYCLQTLSWSQQSA